MRLNGLVVALVAGLGSSLQADGTLSDRLRIALDAIAKESPQNLIVVLGNFTYADSGIGSSLSRFIEDNVVLAIAESPYVDLVVPDALTNLEPEFARVFGPVFRVDQARALLRGRFFDAGRSVRLELEAISLLDATLIGRKDSSIDKSDIPAGVEVVPPGYDKAVGIGREISRIVPGTSTDLMVEASTSRGSAGVYRQGEEVVIYFFVNRDAFVKLYSIDAEGRTKLIYPNQYQQNNQVRGLNLVRVPDDSHPFRFVVAPPFGTEYVKVIACTEQFADMEPPSVELGQATKGLFIRGIQVVGTATAVAEATVSYTAVP